MKMCKLIVEQYRYMVSGAQAACRSGYCHTNKELKVKMGELCTKTKKENGAGHLNVRKLVMCLLHQDSVSISATQSQSNQEKKKSTSEQSRSISCLCHQSCVICRLSRDGEG